MAASRKKRGEKHNLGALRLYQDDLAKIASAVAEVGYPKITCDGSYSASGPEAFRRLPEAMRDVVISARDVNPTRSITVHLCRNHSYVRLVEPDDGLYRILNRIEAVCSGKKRRLRNLLDVSSDTPVQNVMLGVFVAGVVMVAVPALAWLVYRSDATPPMYAIYVAQFSTAITALVGTIAWAFRPWVLIVNAPYGQRPTRRERNLDQLFVGFVMAVVGIWLNRLFR